jgi:hypothetical protein
VRLTLREERREEVARYLCDLIDRAVQDRQRFNSNLTTWRNAYFGELPNDTKNEPFENAANVHFPITTWVIDNIHERLKRVVLTDPMLTFTASAPQFEGWASFLSLLCNTIAQTDMKLPQAMDDVILNCELDSTAILKMVWCKEERTSVHYVLVAEEAVDEDGNLFSREVLKPQPVQHVVCNSPQVFVVPLGDYYLLPADAPARSAALGEAQRHWMRAHDLKERARSGAFDLAVVEELVERMGDDDTSTDVGHSRHVEAKERYEGIRASFRSQTVRADAKWEIFEVLFWYDVDDDGQREFLRAFVSVEHDALLSLEHFPYYHGKSYYIPFRIKNATYPYSREQGVSSFYGISLARELIHLQEEINSINNQILDAGTLSNGGFGIVSKESLSDLNRQKIQPGKILGVDDPNEFQMVQFPGPHATAFSMLNLIVEFAEKLTGVSNTQLGIPSAGDKTAYEIGAVMEEGDVKFQGYVERLQWGGSDGGGMHEVALQMVELMHQAYYEWGFDEVVRELMGDDADDPQKNPFLVPNLFDFYKSITVQPRGSVRTANKQVEINRRMTFWNMLSQEPLMQDPAKRLKTLLWVAELLERSPERFLGTPEQLEQQQQQQQQQPAPPEEQPTPMSLNPEQMQMMRQAISPNGTEMPAIPMMPMMEGV